MTGRSRADLVLIGQQPDEPGRALKYDPRYCEEIRLLAQDGKFPETWCATIGIHKVTLYRWADEYPEFEEAIRIAWVVLQDYWTRFAVTSIVTKDINQGILNTILKGRFPSLYSNKPEILEGTLEHFEARNKPKPTPAAVPGQAPQPIRNREAILAEIAVLQERLKQREAK